MGQNSNKNSKNNKKINRKALVLITVLITAVAITLYANLRSPQKELSYKITITEGIQSQHFIQVLGHLMGPMITGGNNIRALNNGDEIFPAMLTAIKSAEKTITFESYIYWSGKVGNEFADALSEKAKSGVKVHLLIDWLGSQSIDEKLVQSMKDSGVEVQFYHPLRWYNVSRLNNRTHRKILVVDGKTGFTGGVGIADEWIGDGLQKDKWRDTHYKVTGPVVSQMQAAFMDNWIKTQSKVQTSPDYFPITETPSGESYAQMFKSSSREGASSVRIMYMMAIAAAKKSILIENAYFVPDKTTIKELIKARDRGVVVEIITPKHIDNEFVRYASREQWGPLLAAGVKIYEYKPALFHCKVFIVDEYFVSIGSTNFDERSFRLNDEANLNVLDSKFALEQTKTFEKDRSLSEPITFEKWKVRPAKEQVIEYLSSLLHSQI